MTAVLQVQNLRTHFFTKAGVVKAVDDVSFAVGRGKILGLVGVSKEVAPVEFESNQDRKSVV